MLSVACIESPGYRHCRVTNTICCFVGNKKEDKIKEKKEWRVRHRKREKHSQPINVEG